MPGSGTPNIQTVVVDLNEDGCVYCCFKRHSAHSVRMACVCQLCRQLSDCVWTQLHAQLLQKKQAHVQLRR